MYMLVLNGLLLLFGGRCIVSVIAYPYSSRLFRRNLARTTNEKFGEEFRRCVSRLVDVVDSLATRPDEKNLSDIILGAAEDYEDEEEFISYTLNSKEIYLRIA
jgi:hypothetical protein